MGVRQAENDHDTNKYGCIEIRAVKRITSGNLMEYLGGWIPVTREKGGGNEMCKVDKGCILSETP